MSEIIFQVFAWLSFLNSVDIAIDLPSGDRIEWMRQSDDLRYLGFRRFGNEEEIDYAIGFYSDDVSVQYWSANGPELKTIIKWRRP